MDKLKAIILSKPRWVVLLIFSYILILGILKWRLTPDLNTIFYLVGGLFGVYFMDGADLIFTLKPSPFRSILFIFLFGVVSFFIVTSSGSMFAIGLVLSLYFTLLLSAAEEWQTSKNLNSWYTLIQSPPTIKIQQLIVVGLTLLLVVETLIFIR
jgi:hypothetical protein